ncbi:hypothetical protein [Paraburkholderia rhynchosiae]|nr:hypothetical protein [Paraburkholderia rhynchosiae]
MPSREERRSAWLQLFCDCFRFPEVRQYRFATAMEFGTCFGQEKATCIATYQLHAESGLYRRQVSACSRYGQVESLSRAADISRLRDFDEKLDFLELVHDGTLPAEIFEQRHYPHRCLLKGKLIRYIGRVFGDQS